MVMLYGSASMVDARKKAKPAWLLVDSFVGALSDFADETVVDMFSSRSTAVREVKSRIRILESWHQGYFGLDEITLPSNREVDQQLDKEKCVKYQSSDGCRYSWRLFEIADEKHYHLVPASEITAKDLSLYSRSCK